MKKILFFILPVSIWGCEENMEEPVKDRGCWIRKDTSDSTKCRDTIVPYPVNK